MFQMKEQDKATEKELSKVKISNIPRKEFKVRLIQMLNEPKR